MIWIHSQAINLFLLRVKAYARTIVNHEMKLNYRRTRIELQGKLYPLQFFVFEDHQKIGLYDSRFFRIGLNKELFFYNDENIIKNVLRHELAHFYHSIIAPDSFADHAHGFDFHQICHQFHWGPEVSAGKQSLANEMKFFETQNDTKKILSKIQKLFSLGSSPNSYEAEMATAKANELLIKHNLSFQSNTVLDDDKRCIYVKAVLKAKKFQAKHQAIIEILENFFVIPVINRSRDRFFYLEVSGAKLNVELADYIAHYLDLEFENLWMKAQKERPQLKGVVKKNSFMRGLAKGHLSRISKQNLSCKDQLIMINQDLQKNLKLAYPHLQKSAHTKTKHCHISEKIGTELGKNIHIRPGIKNQQSIKKLIGIFKL